MNPVPPRVLAIMEEVAAKHGVSLGDILSRARAAKIADARTDAMRAVAAAPSPNGKPSTTTIGRWFDRDHSTVVHALGNTRGKHAARSAAMSAVGARKRRERLEHEQAEAAAEHVSRLAWAHGNDRAAAIIAGRDPETEVDIARWRALGAKP